MRTEGLRFAIRVPRNIDRVTYLDREPSAGPTGYGAG